jgi:hypothetical protein
MAYLGNTTLSVTTDTYLGNAREGIANNSLFGGVLLANNITTRELSDDSVLSNNIISAAVTETKLADNAVTTNKISNANVTEIKIADRAVTAVKLANTTVAAGTYGAGNGSQIPVIVVDAQGRITTASNIATPVISVAGATGAVSNAQVAAGFTSAIAPGTTGNVLTSTGTTWVSSAAPPSTTPFLFNTSISTGVGYLVTTSMAAAFTAPATAGRRYIIHSIQVTNIGTVDSFVSGELTGTTYPTGISFGDTVSVPTRTTVELLYKPKILQPNDAIGLQAGNASTIHATITIEIVEDDKYFGRGVDVTSAATYVDLYVASANSVIESVLISNDEPNLTDALATVVWTNASDTIQGYFAFDFLIPNDATVELLQQPKFIPNGFKVRVQSNNANIIEAIIAGKTI